MNNDNSFLNVMKEEFIYVMLLYFMPVIFVWNFLSAFFIEGSKAGWRKAYGFVVEHHGGFLSPKESPLMTWLTKDE